MTLVWQALLATAYSLLAHVASATDDDRFAALALIDLWLMILLAPLSERRNWAWWLFPIGVFAIYALWWADRVAIPILLVPVAFIAVIAWWFARSLQPPRIPLITRIVAALEATPARSLPSDLYRYSRALTAAWAVVLFALGVINLGLALIAVPDGLLAQFGWSSPFTVTDAQWSWFANLLNYGILLAFFAGEYQLRKRRFPNRYKNFVEFTRALLGLGPAFWRDFLK